MTLEKLLARMLRKDCLCEASPAFEQPVGHHEHHAARLLATPEGKVLAELVEAAVTWKAAAETGGGDAESWDVYRAVDAYLALGDES